MIVEIKGVQFVNKGAELMLHAILEQLKDHLPNARVAIPVTELSPYECRAKLGALQKFSLRFGWLELNWISYFFPAFIKRLSLKFGIVYESDIDVVLDASGFAYGDQWTDTAIARMAKEVSRYKKNKAKYIFLPQAFGPFTKKYPKAMLNKHLHNAELIIAREEDSLRFLKEAVPALTGLKVSPDFTNLVKGVFPENNLVKGGVIIIPNSNMVSARNTNSGWLNKYEDILVGLGESIHKRGIKVFILNHEGRNDQKICQVLSARLGGVTIINEKDPLIVKGLLGSAEAVISSRFHGCVSALSQGTPCLGTSWSHKYERLYEDYGVCDWILTGDNCSLDELIESLLTDESARVRIKEASVSLKNKSEAMWSQVFEVIESA
jgi:colanic acid/amylovoran biosynthesis protein